MGPYDKFCSHAGNNIDFINPCDRNQNIRIMKDTCENISVCTISLQNLNIEFIRPLGDLLIFLNNNYIVCVREELCDMISNLSCPYDYCFHKFPQKSLISDKLAYLLKPEKNKNLNSSIYDKYYVILP